MADKEDWLLRPITEQLTDYVELHLTRLDLHDFAVMNDALDVRDYNQRKVQESLNNGK